MEDGAAPLFWRILTDLELWADAAERDQLFHPGAAERWRLQCPAELAEPLRLLEAMWARPAQAVPGALAGACSAVARWAEQRDYLELALQFAEHAARLDAEEPALCSAAGRLARCRGEPHRGTMYFRRAVRLARLRRSELEFAVAHLGWGNLEADLGNLREAESHYTKAFRAALRCGRHSLAGSAYHDLLLLKIGLERYEEAWAHALDALAFYKQGHPRFAALAHDIALLWSRQGYYSAALNVFEKVLPLMSRVHERMIVLSNLARASAAAGDRMRYERAVREVLRVFAAGGTVPPSVWVHLGHAALTCRDWERAEEVAAISVERAQAGYVEMSARLAAAVRARAPGDVDLLPEAGSETDRVRDLLLRRLDKHTVPGGGPGTVPPDPYTVR